MKDRRAMQLLPIAMLIAIAPSPSIAQQRPGQAPTIDALGNSNPNVTTPRRRKLPSELEAGVVVWRDIAEEVGNALSAFAKEFKEAHKGDSAAARGVMLADLLAVTYELSMSIQKDLDEAPDEFVVQLSSHTLESLAKFTRNTVIYWYESQTHGVGRLQPYLSYVEPFDKISAGAARWAASDRIDPDAMRDLMAGLIGFEKELGKELIKITSENPASAKLQSALLLADFLPEFIAALHAHEQAGYVSLDVADRYSDALLVFGASLITMVLIDRIPGLAKYSEAVRNGIVAGGKLARTSTAAQNMGYHLHLWFGGRKQKEEILLQYAAYAARELGEGRQPEAFTVHFKGVDLHALGFSEPELAEIDERHQSHAVASESYPDAEQQMRRSGKHRFAKKRPEPPEELRPPPPRRPPPPASSGGGEPPVTSGSGGDESGPRHPPPGGVVIDGASTTQAADLSVVQEAVLKNRRNGKQP